MHLPKTLVIVTSCMAACEERQRYELVVDVDMGEVADQDLSETTDVVSDEVSEPPDKCSLFSPGDDLGGVSFDTLEAFEGGSHEACGLDVTDDTGGIKACWSVIGDGGKYADFGVQRVSTLCDEDAGRCVAPRARCSCGWCYVPPRMFLAGSAGTEGEFNGAWPSAMRSVRRGFWIQQVETSIKDFRDLMGYEPDFTIPCGDDCPVAGGSLFEAMEYANRLSALENRELCYRLEGCRDMHLESDAELPGRPVKTWACDRGVFLSEDCTGYRLPSQAEWELAARAGSPYCFPIGPWLGHYDSLEPDAPIASDYAVYRGNARRLEPSCGVSVEDSDGRQVRLGPQPSRSRRPNAFGLYDANGNVSEHTFSAIDISLRSPENDSAAYAGLPPYSVDENGTFLREVELDSETATGAGWYGVSAKAACTYLSDVWQHRAAAVYSQHYGMRLVRTTPVRFVDD